MKRFAAVAIVGLLALTAPASAQLIPIQPTPKPTAAPATPEPATPAPVTPPPRGRTPAPDDSSAPPSPSPAPGLGSLFEPAPPEAPPEPSRAPGASPAPIDQLVDGVPRDFRVPIFPRTPGRNTTKLVRILEQATAAGIPLEDVLAQGMGRFPVGGIAYYSDDWMAPRFTPIFHLHEGLDIFADFGTPIRSPDRGTVSRITDGAVGGLSVYVVGSDRSEYYFAHLQSVAAGLAVGQPVAIGAVIGYVGDTGNARGGAPHLHFEVHRPGPVPPKPLVDQWLAEAEAAAPQWVSDRIAEILGERDLLRSDHQLADVLSADRMRPGDTPEYSLLLSLLDPIGGSISVLPRVGLVPAPPTGGAGRLLDDLIEQRVQGTILTNFVTGGAARNDAGGGGG